MRGYVCGIDWINAEPMKYWSHTTATPAEKKKQEIRNAVFSGDYIGALKVDGYYERLIKDEDGNCFMVARSKNVKGEATEKLAWVPHILPLWSLCQMELCYFLSAFCQEMKGQRRLRLYWAV